jgi:hypothetical protein
METSPENILSNQLMSNQKINSLLDLASDYVECGPECQKNKKSEELYKKYLKSQNASTMIPEELKKNKKNYYVYTYGDSYYDNVEKTELVKNVSIIIDDIKTEFETQVENAFVMNQLLQTTDPDLNCSDHYPLVQEKLNHEFDKKKNNMMVNNRETYYSSESIEKLEMWNKFWIFIYYFVILVFLILCFPRTLGEFIKYGLILGGAFFYIFIINHTNLFIYDVKFKVIIFIVYFIVLLIIILFILYKIATTFKFVLINLTDTMRKIYNFSER